jgi:hypothetical protein
VSAKFASMPTRTAAHTFTVNSAPGMWDMFHLIRFISEVKGLFMRSPGHMAQNQAREPGTRSNSWASFSVQAPEARCGSGAPQGSYLLVKVYADLNTFR